LEHTSKQCKQVVARGRRFSKGVELYKSIGYNTKKGRDILRYGPVFFCVFINYFLMKSFKKLIVVVVTLTFILSFPLLSAEGNVQAASGREKKVKLVMLDKKGEDNSAVVYAFNSVGVSVTTVYSLRYADPKKYDGLIIPGGLNDITPSLYGAKDSGKNYHPDKALDKRQIKAIRRVAEAQKKPVFGICRGEQVINVAFGGTMKQNIKRHTGWRTVKNKKGSWNYKVLGRSYTGFDSHHQSVKKLGKHLVATSWDKRSKEIEALEHETLPIFGIQWHPEAFMRQAGTQKVFSSFKKVCLRSRNAKTTKSKIKKNCLRRITK